MEQGQITDPYYETALKMSTVEHGHELYLDCGVMLRAIDTLLLIAPREFRAPKEWMLRLYRTRLDITAAIDQEAESNISKEDGKGEKKDFNIGWHLGAAIDLSPSNVELDPLSDRQEPTPSADTEGAGA